MQAVAVMKESFSLLLARARPREPLCQPAIDPFKLINSLIAEQQQQIIWPPFGLARVVLPPPLPQSRLRLLARLASFSSNRENLFLAAAAHATRLCVIRALSADVVVVAGA